jgi:hypothetical protein
MLINQNSDEHGNEAIAPLYAIEIVPVLKGTTEDNAVSTGRQQENRMPVCRKKCVDTLSNVLQQK